MKIKIRYDNQFQTIELNENESEQLCVSLSIDPSTADEKKVQEAFDVQFNRPEYNNWHKENRRIDGESNCEDFFTQYADSSSDMPDFEYEDVCKYVRSVLKPKQAELVISICIDGMSVSEFARNEGVSQPAITSRLQTAKRNLKKFF